ncbi:MAG TPA: helix-turn-helix domain-containing protein [Fimbriimonas sp.]|nr:helix-turn-helix domain-containing protein [Fimbriimonas sp.]
MMNATLDNVFGALSHSCRRDVLAQATKGPVTVSFLAERHRMTLAGILKHLGILERASLIKTEKRGKERYVSLAKAGFTDAADYLSYYEKFWNQQLDSLANFLESENA